MPPSRIQFLNDFLLLIQKNSPEVHNKSNNCTHQLIYPRMEEPLSLPPVVQDPQAFLFQQQSHLKLFKEEEEEVKTDEEEEAIPSVDRKAIITLNDFRGQTLTFEISMSLTIAELKHHISLNETGGIREDLMSLRLFPRNCGNISFELKDHQTLIDLYMINEKAYDNAEGKANFDITQSKITLYQLSKLRQDVILSGSSDGITGEKYSAMFPCGHFMGRDCIKEMITNLTQEHKHTIKCPYNDEEEGACPDLEYNWCKVIGMFTEEEDELFAQKLTSSSVRYNSVECPQCNEKLHNEGNKLERGFCSACGFGEFCYDCLKPIPEDAFECKNTECGFDDEFLTQSNLKEFELVRDYNQEIFMAPENRACPNCFTLLEHTEGCKHMYCTSCFVDFCWICLSIRPVNGAWECEQPFEFCKEVAPAQVKRRKETKEPPPLALPIEE